MAFATFASMLLNELLPLPRVIVRLYEPWMAIVLLSALVLFAIVKAQFPGYLQLIRWNFSNYRIARQTFEEGEVELRPEWLLMTPVMVAALALHVYLYTEASPILCGGGGYWLFFRLMLIIALIYLIKILAIRFVEIIATPTRTLRVYRGNAILLNQTIALPLLMFCMVSALSAGWLVEASLHAGSLLFGGAYVLRLSRGMSSAIAERIPLNYIILYLCTLEFLPLAFLAKAWYEVQSVC